MKSAHFSAPPTGLHGSVGLLVSRGLQSPLNEDYLDVAFNLLDFQMTNGSVSSALTAMIVALIISYYFRVSGDRHLLQMKNLGIFKIDNFLLRYIPP